MSASPNTAFLLDILRVCQKHGASIDMLEESIKTRDDKNSNLTRAAVCGDIDTVKYLLANGANLKFNGYEAARFAAERGRLDVFKFLYDEGADMCADNQYALRKSFENGYTDVVKFIIENLEVAHENHVDDKIEQALGDDGY